MSSATSQTVVGFIGLGNMGDPMASNLAKGGYDLRLFDLDVDRAAALAERIGARAMHTAAELSACSIVVLMLPTSSIVRSVLLTAEGDLTIPFAAGTVIVDMSSSDPNETLETGHALVKHGVLLVDAPVSGGTKRAATGTLAIMLGSDDEAAADRAVPVIETMSEKIFRTGRLGTGHAMKALNNYVAAAAFVASSEALVTGERFGLDPQTIIDIFNASTGQSFNSQHVMGEHIVQKKYGSGFALGLLTKDVLIAQALQKSVAHDSPVCDAVAGALEDALTALGPVDHTLAYTFWEKQ